MKIRESETIELKRSTSELKEAIISISSILNKHHHGELYFGIRKDSSVVGLGVTEKTIRDVSKAIADNIEPKVYPTINQIEIGEKPCIKVQFKGKDAPYFAYGRAYMRVGDENRQLSVRELESLILKKNRDKFRWDVEICQEASIKDISTSKMKSFLKISGLRYDNLKNVLEKLKLVVDGKLRNAAVILFGKNPQSFFPNAKLRCAVFGTMDTSFTVDMKDFEGDLFYLIKRAEEYILENIHIGMRIEGLRRVDVPEIDKEAFREAIINAFCHRDYYEYDSVNIAIFKDRVEIRNPGLLYGGLTIERIKSEMVSERRNELIADMFHEIHFIEKWGRGIRLILSKEPDADFKEVGTHFVTTFKRKYYGKHKKVLEKVTEKVPEKVTENQKKILESISKNRYITAPELATVIGISERKIKENIKKLKQKRLLLRVGPDKGGYWKTI